MTTLWRLSHGRRSNVTQRLAAMSASSTSSTSCVDSGRRGQTGSQGLLLHSFSTSPRFAVIDHSDAYESSMKGRHGQQLALAQIEGIGKDDPPYDPFSDDEQEDEAGEGELDEEDGEDENSEDEEDEYEDLVHYNNDGSVRWKKSQLATFRAGAPAGGMFAIIQVGGFQHKVTVDDVIVSNKLKSVETYSIGSVHTVKDVLLVGSTHLTLVGLPIVGGAEVDLMVEEITRDAKVIVFKKRRRKNSQRRNGFRRDVTLLRVLDIRMPEAHKDHKHILREQPEP